MSPVAVIPVAALSAADLFSLGVALVVCAYLVYALLRGENL